jgi:hypothetical protein
MKTYMAILNFFFISGSGSGFHRNTLDRNPDLAKCLDPYRLKFVKGLLAADILFLYFFIQFLSFTYIRRHIHSYPFAEASLFLFIACFAQKE